MAQYQSQFVCPPITALNRDAWTNTMHWEGGSGLTLSAAATEIAVRLAAFYVAVYSGSNSKAPWYSWNSAYVEVVDIDVPKPWIPEVRPCPVGGSVAGATAVPADVAAVLSYRTAPRSGVPRQRTYNRIYLGGLASAFITATTSNPPVISEAKRTDISNAFKALMAANDMPAPLGLDLVQRTRVPSPQSFEIVQAWVDTEPDTQRRRGWAPAGRTVINPPWGP